MAQSPRLTLGRRFPNRNKTVPPRPLSVIEQQLLERHLHLVRSAVGRVKLNLPTHVDADDLFSIGIMGLIAAVRNFDPQQGHTFTGYAGIRIRGAILDELRRMDWCSKRVRANTNRLKRAINEVEHKFGRPATNLEVRTILGLDAKEYAKWVEEAKPVRCISLDQKLAGGTSENTHLDELLADENALTGREILEKSELNQLLTQGIAELPDKPKKLLDLYYFEEMRHAEIGAVFGLCESSICRIHAQTIDILHRFLKRLGMV